MSHRFCSLAFIALTALLLAATAAQAHAKRYSAWDEQWLKTSIEGDRFEIAGGTVAQQKGANATVNALGAKLAADHAKSLKDAIKVARKLGISVPAQPTPSQQWELRAVSTQSGSEFDRWYSSLEVEDHKQDITESQDEVRKGSNRQVRALAKEDLPMLKEHLKLSKQAAALNS
jgi:putative membrane protein